MHTSTAAVRSTAEGGKPESQRQAGERDIDFFGSRETSRDKWPGKLHLRTENFELVSDWPQEDQLGQVLLALERARALFIHLYDQVPTGVVTVLVNQSLADTRTACKTSHGAGCYSSRGNSHSIILSKDALARGATGPGVHEYTHLAQNLMGYARAPAWVNEGIAEYYQSVEFKKGKLYVGYFDPQRRMPGWLPVESILTLDYGTMNSLGDPKIYQIFYLESHLLVHMLRHTAGYSPVLPQLLNALKQGTDSREAFLRFYGVTPDRLNRELQEYYRRGGYRMVEVYEGIQVPVSVAVADGSGRKVTVKEKKCTWCKVQSVLRRVPIVIPIP